MLFLGRSNKTTIIKFFPGSMIISKLHLVIKFKLLLKIIKASDSYTLRLEQHRLLKFLTENTDFFFYHFIF